MPFLHRLLYVMLLGGGGGGAEGQGRDSSSAFVSGHFGTLDSAIFLSGVGLCNRNFWPSLMLSGWVFRGNKVGAVAQYGGATPWPLSRRRRSIRGFSGNGIDVS